MAYDIIHVNRHDGSPNPECKFCGCPFQDGDRAYQDGDGGPLFCSDVCATFAAEPRHAPTVKVPPC